MRVIVKTNEEVVIRREVFNEKGECLGSLRPGKRGFILNPMWAIGEYDADTLRKIVEKIDELDGK